MHITVLNCNTDRSRFAARHPRDGEKWRALLAGIRPGWQASVFDATTGDLPAEHAGAHGIIVTGSPASANSDDPWVLELLAAIRRIAAARIPLFGACFGHQAIARALGGTLGGNPGPFVLGIVTAETRTIAPWMTPAPASFRIAAAHGEQVLTLPPGAAINSVGPGCEIGGFTIDDHIFTTEYHPEMTRHFITSLTEAMASKLDPDTCSVARASLAEPADTGLFADWLVRFFEQGGTAQP
ncbi:MAG: type 1 glutamine amidotransferase [Rhodobacteraceae bacterium]|nr:type 1 glutamine amidotransferase [Paracoccaceae bacterium]